MPWLPDLEAARQLYPKRTTPGPRLPFYDGMREHDAAMLAESFANRPHVDDPRFGAVDDTDGFVRYVEQVRSWLEEQVAAADPVALTLQKDRSVEERLVRLTSGGTLAVAIVTSFNEHGKIKANTVYYGRES